MSGNAAGRLRDFERRSKHNPHLVVDQARSWSYIPVHPCADETELLAQLEMLPEQCTSVDLWWSDGIDVAFVQIISATTAPRRAPGVYVRLGDGDVAAFVVIAVVANDTVDTTTLRNVLLACSALGLTGSAFRQTELRPTLEFAGEL